MRRLLWGILIVAVLVAVVTGCGGAHRYDARLVAADSLMQAAPDSALAIVEALPADSLTDGGDRAYRDLLLTQARYRCYIVATSDSGINRALSYYRSHAREREKLTRAFIYKGAVMEELGHPDSAMFYYKQAEATADEKDYANLGQINTRIADLYRIHYGDEEICFEKYKQALHYHLLTGNKPMQQNCYFNMANCAADSSIANYRQYYQKAYSLAEERNDSAAMYKCLEYMGRHLLSNDSTRDEAKLIALDCIKKYQPYNHQNIFIDIAFVYAYENHFDSARYYLNLVDTSRVSDQVKMRYYWALSVLYKNLGDTAKSNYYSGLKSHISDSIDNNRVKNSIYRIDTFNDRIQTSSKIKRINTLQYLLWALSLIAGIMLLSVGFYYHSRMRYYKSIIKELELISSTSDAGVDDHEELLQQIGNKDSVIGQFVQSMVTFMHTSIDLSERDTPSVIKRRIRETIGNVITDEFWDELKAYLDRSHNNLISTIAKNPKISDIDLKFIELSCCGFDYVEIAVALGLSTNYISTKRKAIARKLGVKDLRDYLKTCMK
jgi:hypothetical protein